MAQANAKLLLVEDNDLDVEKIQRGLRKMNVSKELFRAEDGYEALDMLRGSNGYDLLKPPYVILLDLNMPRMNGLEFLKELRADERLKSTPVFILTTSSHPADISSAYEFNVSGYILKPVAMEEMRVALNVLNDFVDTCELPN